MNYKCKNCGKMTKPHFIIMEKNLLVSKSISANNIMNSSYAYLCIWGCPFCGRIEFSEIEDSSWVASYLCTKES